MIPEGTSWRGVLAGLLLFKAAYFALLIGALGLWGDFDESVAEAIRRGWFPEAQAQWLAEQQTGFRRYFTTWDAAHYLVLSETGYVKDLRSCAFYPLWPMAVRGFAVASGISPILAGLVLSNVCSIAAWVLFWAMTRRRFGEATAGWALAWMVLFPGSLFFQFIYSESVFLLLVMILWFGLERDRPVVAGIGAFLLPLTRAVGVFALAPILWHSWERSRKGRLCIWVRRPETRDQEGSADATKERQRLSFLGLAKAVSPIGALLLGWATGLLLMRVWTGNPWEGFAAQEHWRTHAISNLWDLPRFIFGFFEPTAWHAFHGSVLDRLGFLILALSFPLLWRLGKDLAVWACVLGVVPAMSGTFASFIRFESVVFPLFLGMGAMAASAKAPWRTRMAALVIGLLHVVLVWRFVNYRWAG
jgi:hypothetical protein